MAKSNTTLKKGDNLPARGRSNKTIILEMLREKGHLSLGKDATKEEAEKAFFHNVATSAFDLEDQNRGMCLKLLADKGWASVKPSSEMIEFEFDINAPPHVQAAQVMKGVSEGKVAPDIGNTFVQSIKAMIDIEEYTDLKERIEKLEATLNGDA
jgi:hypothetical protein